MVVFIENAKTVAHWYRETQLNIRPNEKNLFRFTIENDVLKLAPSYEPFKENFIGFLKSIGVRHKIQLYR
jgi:hypothetical protein